MARRGADGVPLAWYRCDCGHYHITSNQQLVQAQIHASTALQEWAAPLTENELNDDQQEVELLNRQLVADSQRLQWALESILGSVEDFLKANSDLPVAVHELLEGVRTAADVVYLVRPMPLDEDASTTQRSDA